jgi:uncharacterized LabA/DUF88 family protein
MPISSGGTFYAGVRHLMVFIDGGYLRRGLTEYFGGDLFNYARFVEALTSSSNSGRSYSELIRAYYYDAIVADKDSPKYEKQNEYLRRIRDLDYFEVRLGRLKLNGGGLYKQKGVDTLIALDMLSKAYENH